MTTESGKARELMTAAMRQEKIAGSINNREGEITENSQVVLRRRYLAKDRDGNVLENPDGMFRRVARNLSEAELEYGATQEERQAVEDEFHDVMTHLEFVPNSPTLMNAGRELQQLSACFVIPVEDTLDSIFSQIKATALIHQSGGGTGFSFARVRPKGDLVGTTGGVASGPVSFIGAFDGATEVVKQGGTRRGANMAILNVDHPDIMRFIREKRDPTKLVNFNVSVAVNEDFMKRVRDGRSHDLIHPNTGAVTNTLEARDVFREIVECAWETGDPGIVFLDRINDENPNPHLGRIESTNPCVTGDTMVYTSGGMRRARKLYEEQSRPEVTVDSRRSGGHFNQASTVFSSGRKQVHRLRTHEGYEVRLTAEHRVMTNRGWVPAQDLREGDEIHLLDQGGGFGQHGSLEMGQTLGWLIGDGTLKSDGAVLCFLGRKRELAPEAAGPRRSYTIGVVELESREESRASSSRFRKIAAEYGLIPGSKCRVPEHVMTGTRDMQSGFLQGLFSADGHVNLPDRRGAGIHLTSISREMIIDVQRVLLNLGIASRIYFDRRTDGVKELPDGHGGSKEYNTQAYHELVISRHNLDHYRDSIGLLGEFKQGLLREALESYGDEPKIETFTARFLELVPESEEEVFDLTESVTHSFVANGLVVSNCGEQPLLPYESCNLGSVNLARMLHYTEDDVEIDWDRMERTIRTGVHMLDNVIDMNRYPLEEIAEMSRKTRRIGLGLMGWADMLVQLGIRYDSQEALDLARDVMRFIQQKTHAASTELATYRGVYPAWEDSIYDPPAGSGREAVQMRNSAPVTIAPTGTISIIAGASSGIEPLFALAYTRNVMDNDRLVETNPYFHAACRTHGFGDQEMLEQVARTGTLEGTDAPGWARNIFRVSRDIAPEWHVRMQAAFQAHTDNSVSKTINLPHDATPDDVERAYMLAYETGCKGITVYRDGSKDRQVLSTGQPDGAAAGETQHAEARPRPRQMSGITERFRTGHGNMYITVNFDENCTPFEIFAALGKAGGCDSAQLEAVSRLASLGLRSGLDPWDIVTQLQGITCCPAWDEGTLIRSAPDAMAHMLRRALGERANGERANGEREDTGYSRRRCPDCQSQVEFREGCEACTNPACGWNKCE